MRQLPARGASETEARRAFPRWQAHRAPRCPKHPSRAMQRTTEALPKFVAATGRLKGGKRVVWRCKQCPMVVAGETTSEVPTFMQGGGWLEKI
jgi:hypothetical protein